MAREETIQIKIDKKNAESSIKALKQEAEALKKTFASIKVSDTSKAASSQEKVEKAISGAAAAYKGLKKEMEKPINVKSEETAIQKIINGLTGVSSKAKNAEKSFESMAKAEVKMASDIQKAYDKINNSSQKEAFKGFLERAKAASQVSEEYRKVAAAEEKAFSNRSNTAFQNKIDSLLGIGRSAKSAQDSMAAFAKAETASVKEIQAAYDKMSESKRKAQRSEGQEAFKGYLERVKEAEEFLKVQEKIQAAYDKESNTRAKSRQSSAQEGMSGYLERAKEAEEFLKVQEKIQAAYDKEANTRAKSRQSDAKEAFKGYLERATAAEKEAQATEKLTKAKEKLGVALGTVDKANATSLQSVAQFIHQQQGLENATVKATGAVHNSSGSFQTYKASVQNADGTMQNFKVSVNTATGEVYSLDKGITSVSGSLGKMAQSAWSTVKQIIGFTGVAQSLRYAFTEMKSMSDEMVTYRKVTGATAQEMEQIRAASYDIAKKYGQTPSDFLKAASEMARAGYGANSVAMAELATKTQLVGDMTAEMASKFLLTVDAGYKYRGSIEELTAVLDSANSVDNKYATSIEKIAEGMTLIASLGGQAGVPIEQLIAALGTLTASTQRSGAEMARGLRSIFLNVMKDTSTEIEEGVTVTEENIEGLTDALAHYAPEVVKAANATGKLINPMEAIGALAKAYKEGLFTEQELFAMSKDIAGQRYYNAFAALIENYDGMYQSMLETISGSAGSAQKEVDNMLNSWSVKFEQLKTQFVELVNTSIKEGFIKDLLDGGTAALNFAGSLENLAMMAGGAYEAIKSLSYGLKNLHEKKAFGGFNLATMGLSLGIAAIGAWKSAYEKQIRDMQAAAAKAIDDAMTSASNAKSVDDIFSRYEEIASDGIQTEAGELEELKTLQSELNGLVGDQADAIDIVNGKYAETSIALKNLAKQQLEASRDTLTASMASAVNSFTQSDLNGFWTVGGRDGYGYTNVSLSNFLEDGEALQEYIELSRFFGIINDPGGRSKVLGIKKPDTTDATPEELARDIIDLIDEANAIYNMVSNSSYATKYPAQFSNLKNLIDELSKAVGGKDLNAVLKQIEEIDKLLNGESGEGEKSEGKKGGKYAGAAEGVAELKDKFTTLTSSINAATKAKSEFDKAMETSKADGMNDYMSAFETLQKEIKEGRVNSTAFYASARMLMGETAYMATGGESAKVMERLRAKGTSGSLEDAYNILTQKYYDQNDNLLEGYGIYRLLQQTAGFTKEQLTSAQGGAYIPDLTEADLDRISNAWGGLSKELIVSWIDAFDQYDKTGKATNNLLVPEETDKTKSTIGDFVKPLEEAAGTGAEALDGFTEALHGATDALGGNDGESDVSADDIGIPNNAEGPTPGPNLAQAGYHHGGGIDGSRSFKPDTETVSDAPPLTKLQRLEMLDSFGKEAKGEIEDATVDGISDAIKNQQTWEMPPIDLELNPEPAEKTVEEVADKAEETIGEPAKKKWGDYENSIQQMGALKEELLNNGMQFEEAMESLGTNWEEVTKAFAEFKRFSVNGNTPEQQLLQVASGEEEIKSLEDEIEQFFQEWTGQEIIFGLNANPDEAVRVANSTVQQINQKSATIKINGKFTGIGGVGGLHLANGTKSHEGGAAFVNDGAGPELIVQNGRAFIAGGGKPALVSLEKGAKVFTASETRNILYGSGAPAYAFGSKGIASMMTDSGGGGKKSIGTTGAGSVLAGIDPTKVKTEKSDDSSKEKEKSSGGSSGGGGSSDKKENNDAFAKLKEIIDYILNRIGIALDEQVDIIDKQIDELRAQRERQNQQNELEEKQKAVAEAQKDLADAMNERTVRYLGSDGKWHWMADARNVQSAQESLDKAQQDLAEYRDEMAFNAQIEALENQKKALQDEYNGITKTWNDIQTAVGTPTGTVGEAISNVMAFGTDQEKKGASTVQSLLLSMMGGGSYAGNYNEALDALAKATAGSPIMPGEGVQSLASLIARSGMYGGSVTDAMIDRASPLMDGASYGGATGIGSQTVYNYYVDGMKIGADKADQPLSTILRDLSVYTNSAVS